MSRVPALWILVGLWFGQVSPVVKIEADSWNNALHEDTSSAEFITGISCTDPDIVSNTAFYVTVDDSTIGACRDCFHILPRIACGTSSDFCLYFYPQQTLSYSSQRVYTIGVECQEVNNPANSDKVNVIVSLIPNVPPIFSTPISVAFSVPNTETISKGGSVYAVSCSDADGDSLQYDLTTTSNLFTIDNQGVIRAAENLVAACFSFVSFAVTCSDRRRNPIGPVYIDVTLNGANEQPALIGLNYNLDIPEDTAEGTTLASFSVMDDDDTTCFIAANPSNSLQYFDLDTVSSTIEVKTALDYEQVATRNTNLTVFCTDNYCNSQTYFLYVRVTDVNEPITLLPSDFTLSTYEGQITLDPRWTPIDPDIDDDPIFTIVGGNNNNYFTINPETGIITSTLEYDVDQNAMPRTDFLIVRAMDEAGHVSTATVTLIILDFNDNQPILTVGTPFLTIMDCPNIVGTTIGTAVVADDRDSDLDGNNVLTYTATGGPVTVDNNGNIIVTGAVTVGLTYQVRIQASDSGTGPGGLKTSLPVVVTIFVDECVTTTAAPPTTAGPTTAGPTPAPTTAVVTTEKNSRDNLDENLAWIIFAGLFATVLLAAMIFMIWRFCYPSGFFAGNGRFMAFCNNACGDCCTPRPAPRTVQPVRGQPPISGMGSFWQEHYLDNNYNKPPDRDRTPSPAPVEGVRPLEPSSNWRPRQHQEYF